MTKQFIFYFLAIIFFLACDNQKQTSYPSKKENTQKSKHLNKFNKISSSKSNITFRNTIQDDITTKENLFDFDFFFNGAGVAIGDINNDGMDDIFFSGNQVQNKLYINKGDFVFQDISETANINQGKKWANGVTLVDINNDGWLDIYISQGGPNNKSNRKNVLLINQKNLTFKEKTSKYGLDDSGISTQSAFFDYDKDGDLDCIVMNENDLYGYDPDRFYSMLKNTKLLEHNTSKLYRNDNGTFKNVTQQSGLLNPSFGLGLCVSDINNDGWLDIYIANDYFVPDALYINNKNGTFTDQIKNYTKQVSFYGMGIDIADINNDNLKDIFVLDMASNDHIRAKTLMASMNVFKFNLLIDKLDLQYQYMFNSLQLNMGNDVFHNIAQSTKLAKTDWSWSGLILDFDHDTNEDIFVTNGYRKYALDNDIRQKILNAKQFYKGQVPLQIKQEIYNSLPSEKLPNILFKNNGDLSFDDITSTTVLNEPSFSNGASYADLDNDGDLDIVINNIDDEAFIYQNLSVENKSGNFLKIDTKGATSEDFAKVTINYNGTVKTKESKRVRGYMSAVDKTIHFGLDTISKIDTLTVKWLSGKVQKLYNVSVNHVLTLYEKDAIAFNENQSKSYFFQKENLIPFKHKENSFDDFKKEILLPYKQSTLGPYITEGDVNGDGKDDLYIGGALGQAGELYIQTEKGFQKVNNPVFKSDSSYEDMEALFFDIDGDNDNDLYVVSGGNEFSTDSNSLKDRLYINNGKGHFTKNNTFNSYSGKTITPIDFDKDGDTDIIIGNRIKPQHYPLSSPSITYENDNGKLKDVTSKIAPDLDNFGIINKIITTDFDNDGWHDFIAIGEWTHIGLFKNNNGIFQNISSKSGLDNETGWWFSITETDINSDGYHDYVLGNIGLNIKFKVTPQKPLKIYADDFDNNGTHDVVLSYKYNDIFVPVRGRECSSQQMPFIKEKMPTFNEFANSSLQDIYGEKIYTAYNREVNNFHSIVLLNNGDGTFSKQQLPNIVQTMPILDFDTYDFNADGYEDIIAVGNIYNTEVETPRLDNPYAFILLSNKSNNYTVLTPEKTGLYLNGNAKSISITEHQDLNKLIITVAYNNAAVQTFSTNLK